jgi:phosphoglycolate phosphatase
MFRYDAVLFDMDGTLLDTVDDLTDALNLAMAEYQYPAYDREQVKRFIGSGAAQLIERALPGETDGEVLRQVLLSFKARYSRMQDTKTHPYPGILPMLTALDEAGLKLAIISNKSDPNVKQLAKGHFGNLIHIALGAREGVPVKPAPDLLLRAMRQLNVEPERTLYIGDSDVDYRTAQNAGMDCILVCWGYGNPEIMDTLSPLFFVHDPAELPMLILQVEEDAP